ncbi:ATP-grasp domain-containing protein [Sphingomonas koreensis]
MTRGSRRIAYLACHGTATTSPVRRHDASEHDHSLRIFGPAFEARGYVLEEVVWDAPDIAWRSFNAAIIGTTWDYAVQPDRFLATLQTIASLVPIANPPALVEWNLSKRYLRELKEKGVPSIPTLWADRLADLPPDAIRAAIATEQMVMKPVVGAGGVDQFKAMTGTMPPPGHPLWHQGVMIQPFMASIAGEGELSFIFFDGAFSHAVRKTPAGGDYRVQAAFDGREHAFTPATSDLASAQAVIDALPAPALYARVDLVRGTDGTLSLMECELIEPYLYPLFDASKGENLVMAVDRWLKRTG